MNGLNGFLIYRQGEIAFGFNGPAAREISSIRNKLRNNPFNPFNPWLRKNESVVKNKNLMNKKKIIDVLVKVIVAALTAALTAITTTSCMGRGPFYL